jgi:hypothetical protein
MEEFKYYTLFGVELTQGKDMKPNLARDFIHRWTTNERESAKLAMCMVDNKMYKTSKKEAVEAVGLGIDAACISGIKSRMMFCPQITAHLFETDFVLEDDYIEILIDAANVSDFGKEQLAASQIRL